MAVKPKLALIPSGYKAGKVYSVLPSDGSGDFDNFSRSNQTATRVNKDGLIETVGSNIPRLNYPMIDGVVSGCPSLLLEPSVTNYINNSQTSASIEYNNVNSITENSGISPDGTLNAIKIDADANDIADSYRIVGSGAIATFSIFAKSGSRDLIGLNPSSTGSTSLAVFNLSNGEITYTSGSQYIDSSIENYGNGWYRCSITFTTGTGSYINRIRFYDTGTYEIYGMQLENSSFMTSYIPTNGSSVTRSAETCNGAGDADTFNDSEGVLFAEISALANDGTIREIALSNGGAANRIEIRYSGSNIQGIVRFGASVIVLTYNLADTTEFTKVALKYKSGDYSFWVNGLELQVDTTTGTPTGLSEFAFDDGNGNDDFYGNTKQIQYFDTALSDTDLETLTSWTSFNEMAQAQLYTIQ